MSACSRKGHCARLETIADLIEARWHIRNPYHWRLKHLRWVLDHGLDGRSIATKTDYFYTITKIAQTRGRLDAWKPRLRGPWVPRPRNPGGRPRI